MTQKLETRLLKHSRCFVVAPAGCGKTELIAQSVAHSQNKRQLILTHTHAGVSALKKRLSRFQVPASKYEVSTIAGWALMYAGAYPQISQIPSQHPQKEEWEFVYRAAKTLLENPTLKKAIQISYGGVFVDEYQDCSKAQHELILSLATLLPCRIFGDPLQGIFGFNNIIDWKEDVKSNFDFLCELSTFS